MNPLTCLHGIVIEEKVIFGIVECSSPNRRQITVQSNPQELAPITWTRVCSQQQNALYGHIGKMSQESLDAAEVEQWART